MQNADALTYAPPIRHAPPIRPRLMALYKCALIDWLKISLNERNVGKDLHRVS